MALVIETKQVKVHGLEVFEVRVNGSLLSTFMSEAQAKTKVKQCLHAWNIEKVGKSTIKMVG